LSELKRLATEDPRPVSEIYDELASNASTSLDTAAYFPSWDQARNTMYYSRAKRCPQLLARRQDLRLTAEQTTKSGAQFLMKDLPTYSRIFKVLHSKAKELGVQLDPAKFVCDFETALMPTIQGDFPNTRVQELDYIHNQEIRKTVKMLMALAFLPVNLVPTGFEILNVGTLGPVEALFEYFQREWLQATEIPFWNVHGVVVWNQQPSGRLAQPYEQKST
ncbi:hypothetical protein T4B_14915, partial [Trichinella pseudospiralis]